MNRMIVTVIVQYLLRVILIQLEAINNDAILLALNDLLNDLHLVCCDDLEKTGVGYTKKYHELDQQSYIDHFYISEK